MQKVRWGDLGTVISHILLTSHGEAEEAALLIARFAGGRMKKSLLAPVFAGRSRTITVGRSSFRLVMRGLLYSYVIYAAHLLLREGVANGLLQGFFFFCSCMRIFCLGARQ